MILCSINSSIIGQLSNSLRNPALTSAATTIVGFLGNVVARRRGPKLSRDAARVQKAALPKVTGDEWWSRRGGGQRRSAGGCGGHGNGWRGSDLSGGGPSTGLRLHRHVHQPGHVARRLVGVAIGIGAAFDFVPISLVLPIGAFRLR